MILATRGYMTTWRESASAHDLVGLAGRVILGTRRSSFDNEEYAIDVITAFSMN